MSVYPSTGAHLSNLFGALFAAFCPLCWVPIRRDDHDHFPTVCPRCTAPLLPADLTRCAIELNRIDLERTLPFGPEWLMLDRVSIPVEWTSTIHGEPYTATGTFAVTEEHCRGHFPGNPILPGVLLPEITNQAFAAIVITMRKHLGFEDVIDPRKAPYLGMVTKFATACARPVRPGDLLTVKVATTRIRGNGKRGFVAVEFDGSGTVKDTVVFTTKNTCMVTTRVEKSPGAPHNGVPTVGTELMSSGGD